MPKFAENPSYREYERLLLSVHGLIRRGLGDSPEADALREQLETPASSLSSDELHRLDGLSADLYMLQGEEVPARDWETWDENRLRSSFAEAWRWNDWGAILALLRQNSARILPVPQIAYFRGRAYSELGHVETAFVFMQYAASLNPSFHYFELDLLYRFDRHAAILLAERYLKAPNETSATQSLAAGVLFQSTRGMSESRSREIYEDIVVALGPVLSKARRDQPLLPAVQAHAVITMALALDALGRSDEALQAYDRALKMHPENDAILLGRGIANLARDPTRALSDFQRAVALGTRALIPYLAVGVDAMQSGRYHQALQIVLKLQEIASDPEALAIVHEWTAIIGAETGESPDLVRRHFQAATELNPGNTRIQHNAQVFEERVRLAERGERASARWQMDDGVDLHEARAQASALNRSPLMAVH